MLPDIRDGRRGIAPIRDCAHILTNELNAFVCIKLNFFPTIFLSSSDTFDGVYNRNKTRPWLSRIQF